MVSEAWKRSQLKGRTVLPFDVTTRYGKALLIDEAPIPEHVLSGTGCATIGMTVGSMKSMASIPIPDQFFYFSLTPGDGEKHDYSKTIDQLQVSLVEKNMVEVVIHNHRKNSGAVLYEVPVRHIHNGSLIGVDSHKINPGHVIRQYVRLGEHYKVTANYEYTINDEIIPYHVSASGNKTVVRNYVESEITQEVVLFGKEMRTPVDSSYNKNAERYELVDVKVVAQLHGITDEESIKPVYILPVRNRPKFTGHVVFHEAAEFTSFRYVPHMKFDEITGELLPGALPNSYESKPGDYDVELFPEQLARNLTADNIYYNWPDSEFKKKYLFSSLSSSVDQKERVVRTFSEYGFAVGRLPSDLHQLIYTYWRNNKKWQQLEKWGEYDVAVNYWDVQTTMSIMPFSMSKYVSDQLHQLTTKWVNSNIQPHHITDDDVEEYNLQPNGRDTPLPKKSELPSVGLETTSIYGIREYHHGNRLIQHVDRLNTHAASVIVNVGQTNVKEPWPLEIYDHANRLHEVVMAPGDILYYESAKCLHSRIRPFAGENFANIFSHYRPLNEKGGPDPLWYERNNPLGTVKPFTGMAKDAEKNVFASDGARTAHTPIGSSDGSLKKRKSSTKGTDEEEYAVQFLSEDVNHVLTDFSQLYRAWIMYDCPGNCTLHE